jgi:hypothetical protein
MKCFFVLVLWAFSLGMTFARSPISTKHPAEMKNRHWVCIWNNGGDGDFGSFSGDHPLTYFRNEIYPLNCWFVHSRDHITKVEVRKVGELAGRKIFDVLYYLKPPSCVLKVVLLERSENRFAPIYYRDTGLTGPYKVTWSFIKNGHLVDSYQGYRAEGESRTEWSISSTQHFLK